MSDFTLVHGDCREAMRAMQPGSVNTCVTSPPYFGLRDYGHADQLGLEPTPEAYIANMVEVFREVRRVLRDDGTLWLNLGDSYAGSGRGIGDTKTSNKGNRSARDMHDAIVEAGAVGRSWVAAPPGYKQKDLIGIPWMLAFALRADGWYLRSDIIWHKPNPMPESVTDRPTKAHEYLFLMSKSQRYFYDADAIAERLADSSIDRLSQNVEAQAGSDRVPGKTNGTMKAVSKYSFAREHKAGAGDHGQKPQRRTGRENIEYVGGRNKRSVWTVATQPFREAHFATFPKKLIEPCILAGSPAGGLVLDPFTGSGTTGVVAIENGRNFIGCELNPEYVEMARKRIGNAQPSLFAEGA